MYALYAESRKGDPWMSTSLQKSKFKPIFIAWIIVPC